MKKVFLLACLMAVVSSCSTVRERREAAEIKKVFEADGSAHAATFHGKNVANLPVRSAPALVTEYTSALRHIDMTKTPTDFQVAYLKHIQAWEGLAEEMRRRPEPLDLSTILKLVGAATAHAHPLGAMASVIAAEGAKKSTTATPTRAEAKELAQRKIRGTWNTIEVVALRKGVDLREQRQSTSAATQR